LNRCRWKGPSFRWQTAPRELAEARLYEYERAVGLLVAALLAKEATTAQSKQTFENLAQSWTRLAAELDNAQSLLNALNGMENEEAA
jgi:hypothetical protein